MMPQPPTRERETRELIESVRAKQRRHRTIRIVSAAGGGLLVIALVVVAAMFAARGTGGEAGASSTLASAGATTTAGATAGLPSSATQRPPTTYHRVSTTSPTGDPTSTATTDGPAVTAAAGSTSTSQSTSTTSAAPSSTMSTVQPSPSGLVVCIDPGHQARGDSEGEPVGPGSSEMKARTSDGTAGAATGIPESELVLAVSLKLRDALTARGIEVVMTRTTQDVRLSNVERAQIANECGADLFVRVHADGSENSSVSGIHVLYPAAIQGWTDDIASVSKQAAALAQRELVAATGAKDRGIDARSDMTGFNWSDVPVILPEIGFMSNPAEDRLLATPAYQDKIVAGLARAILAFLGA